MEQLAERLERVERRYERVDIILRGDGDDLGLVARMKSLEELASSIRRLATWAILGVLSVWASLAWSIAQEFIRSRP